MLRPYQFLIVFLFFLVGTLCQGEDVTVDPGTVEADLGASREASRTDTEVLEREEEKIALDGLSVAQMKELRAKAHTQQFQAEVNRMMKLIINSLYRNKEIFLRELISNASDALDKIRLMSLTDSSVLDSTEEMSIKIKADRENHVLHIIDTGIGMTRNDLIQNLGTIAKSGTSEFLNKLTEAKDTAEMNDLIGQFGVGFYSAFLVADKVVVTSKHNDDPVQHIWESDSASFQVMEDPRGPTLKRGTQVSLHMKEEAYDFLAPDTIMNLVRRYSQFINFPIYVYTSKTEEVFEDVEEAEKPAEEEEKEEEKKSEEDGEDGIVEEETEKKEPEKRKVEKTVWDWERVNSAKPIWMRKPEDIEAKEYNEFYRSLSKHGQQAAGEEPLGKTHFVAEGEVTFKALLFIPPKMAQNHFQSYGKRTSNIKLYVRRVFITDDFEDLIPSYLSFVFGVVDSDDLPLNISRETLQQHKLLKVIKKKLVRKVLDMIKKMEPEVFEEFWAEYSTNIKLGVIEDPTNRARLAKLLRFESSALEKDKMTSLAEYIERMPENQDMIYYMAGQNRPEVENSPFVERLLKKGFEVLYMTEAIDEYCINAIPEFEGKKFQSVAKEGLKIASSDEEQTLDKYKEDFKDLCEWLKNDALKNEIDKAEVGMRLEESPSALVASQYGWTGNMQRLIMSQTHSKKNDVQRDFYLHQKQHLEINPRHPIVKKLRDLVAHDSADQEAHRMAKMMFRTAVLRSGFLLQDTASFAKDIEQMMRFSMGIPLDEPIEEEIESGSPSVASESPEEVKAEDSASSSDTFEDKDEL